MKPRELNEHFSSNGSTLETWVNGIQYIGLVEHITLSNLIFYVKRTQVEALVKIDGKNVWKSVNDDVPILSLPTEVRGSSEEIIPDVWGRISFPSNKIGFGLAMLYPPGLDPKLPLPRSS